MTARGFIQDKLEIKFLILYLAARVIEPVPFDTLLDLTLCDDAVDYFDFSECLADLVKTEHLTLDEESGLYAITEKGRRNSEICETSLPYSVRLRCDKNLNACNRALRRKNQVKSSTEPRANGTYTVSLSLDDDAKVPADRAVPVSVCQCNRWLVSDRNTVHNHDTKISYQND